MLQLLSCPCKVMIKLIKCCCKKSPGKEASTPSQKITPTNNRMQYQKGAPQRPPLQPTYSNESNYSNSSDLNPSYQGKPRVSEDVYQEYLDDLLKYARGNLVFFNIPGLEKERPEHIKMRKHIPFSLAGRLGKRNNAYIFKLPKDQEKQRREVLPGGVCKEIDDCDCKTLKSSHFSAILPGHVVSWFISKQAKYTVINNA